MSENQGKLVTEFEKNSSETVKVHLQKWGQGVYCDIRVWATPAPGDLSGVHPTKKGITLRIELLPELRKAIDRTIAEFEFGEGGEVKRT